MGGRRAWTVLLWLLDNRQVSNGLFNLGSGQRPQLSAELIGAMRYATPLGRPADIRYSSCRCRTSLEGQVPVFHTRHRWSGCGRRAMRGRLTPLEDGDAALPSQQYLVPKQRLTAVRHADVPGRSIPVLIEIGPFAIRWYALAYIAGHRPGLVAHASGWWRLAPVVATPQQCG